MASIDNRNGRYRDPLDRARCRTFRRKADADRFAREVEYDKDRGQWIDPRKAESPLRTWVETYLQLSISLAPMSLATYRRDLELYILPALGDRRLSHLHPEDIEQWLASEIAAGYAPSSVHRHYRTLRRVLQSAVEKERPLSNPCTKVCPPRVPISPMTFLDWHQSVAVAEAHPARLRAMIYLALDSGMRWSELSGFAAARSTSCAARSASPSSCSSSTACRTAVRRRRTPGSARSPSRRTPPPRSPSTSPAARPTATRWCSPRPPARR